MIKSEVIDDIKIDDDYPRLKIHSAKDEFRIVLFSEPSVGMIVAQEGDYMDGVGHHYSEWIESSFSDYKGKVVIENK